MKWLAKAELAKTRQERPIAEMKVKNLEDHMRLRGEGQRTIVEFLSGGQFGAEWYTRQQYEVFAGRDEEPELWQPIYSVEVNPNLPKVLDIYTMSAGVVFQSVVVGGEVKFATLTETDKTIRQVHYAVGVQYDKDMIKYNRIFDIAMIERRAGIAYNALRNHVHLSPIISATYTGNNATAASSIGSTLLEKYMSTIEAAIETAKANGRRGPYILMIAGGNSMKMANALKLQVQDGAGGPRAGISQIRAVIEYDGWEGTMGAKTTTYEGVTANTAYLISTQYQDQDFLSKISQELDYAMGNPDVSRFILEQTIWDTYFGMFAAPLNAVQKITLPTS